jgi:hypothetical protein
VYATGGDGPGAPYPEPYPGAWVEYAAAISRVISEGLAAGPDNLEFYDSLSGHLLLNRQFYYAISGKDWCWFFFNNKNILDDYGKYTDERNFNYGKYADDRNFAYGKYSDDKNFAYGKCSDDRNLAYGKYSDDKSYAYNDYRNAIEDEQWRKEINEAMRQYNNSLAFQKQQYNDSKARSDSDSIGGGDENGNTNSNNGGATDTPKKNNATATWTLVDNGGINWFGGVDNNAKVKDPFTGETKKLSQVKEERFFTLYPLY